MGRAPERTLLPFPVGDFSAYITANAPVTITDKKVVEFYEKYIVRGKI